MSIEMKDKPDVSQDGHEDSDDCACGHCKTIVPLCMELAAVVNTWKARQIDPAISMRALIRFMAAMTVSMALTGREALGGLEVVGRLADTISKMAESQQQKLLQGLLGAMALEMTPNVSKGKAN